MEKEWFITKEKISVYLKKFWWIIVVFSVVGIILFGMGIYQKQYATKENIMEYTQTLFPQIKDDSIEKTTSVVAVSDNCTMLLQMSDIQGEINNELKRQGLREIEQWSSIEFAPKLNSSFLSITINSIEQVDKIEKEITVVLDILNRQMEKYSPNIYLVKVGDIQTVMIETATKTAVELLDIIVLLACICVGIFIVYLIMIFDSHVSGTKDLEIILGMKPEICICPKEIEIFDAWVLAKKDVSDILFVLGEGTENVENRVNGIEENIYCVKTQEKNYGEIIHNRINSKKYLIVKALTTKQSEIDKIMQINQICKTGFDGWVYIK